MTKGRKVGRRDLQQALENLMFSLALYSAGKGSVAEGYLQAELDKMCESIKKSVTPDGMIQLQTALAKLLEIEAAKVEQLEEDRQKLAFEMNPPVKVTGGDA